VYIPRAFVHQARFDAAVQRAARKLAPRVVRVTTRLGEDWTGEPAAFLDVVFDDSVFSSGELGAVIHDVKWAFMDQVQPAERWGVYPYFNFHGASEESMPPGQTHGVSRRPA